MNKLRFCLSFLLIFIETGYMAQIGYKSIGLEMVIERSDCVLIAKKNIPDITQDTVKISGVSEETGEECPPFIKEIHHFTVVEVLKADKKIKVNSKIKVLNANQENRLEIHKDYYLKGLGISPEYEEYNQDRNVYENSRELILFLCACDNETFEFTVERAYESVDLKSKVRKIIRKKK